MTRKPIIAGNWKLNKTIQEAIELVTLLKRQVGDIQNVEIVVCPPYTALSSVSEILVDSDIKLGAQDVYWEEKGAFTGEVSPSLIKDAGAQVVIIGHSERRQFFHETDEGVNKKTKAVLKAGLAPIVCVGETLAEREADKTIRVIQDQLRGAFAHFSNGEMKEVAIAYEPVWAIGTGKVATPLQAGEVHDFIRKELSKSFGHEVAEGLRILYGGSVKPDNIARLMQEPDIDGALVGGASLDAAGFSEIVKSASIVTV
ncbi:MAG: triose-phosphate isomerase [Omnitrophica bacterium RIFCSPHIGHO2_02_FULL_51_18]|nr:MAG: triose-phosphate isomerase [Omnitrophica bacterium RIFCSPHIGHO2_02_FULL_51_18]